MREGGGPWSRRSPIHRVFGDVPWRNGRWGRARDDQWMVRAIGKRKASIGRFLDGDRGGGGGGEAEMHKYSGSVPFQSGRSTPAFALGHPVNDRPLPPPPPPGPQHAHGKANERAKGQWQAQVQSQKDGGKGSISGA